MPLKIEIVSAHKSIYSGEASLVVASVAYGEVGIKAGHAPMLAALKPGEIRVVSENTSAHEEIFYVSSGFLEVQPSIVIVLADTAARADDVDEAQAVEAKARAEEALQDKNAAIDYAKARIELARAVAQLNAIRHMREKTTKR